MLDILADDRAQPREQPAALGRRGAAPSTVARVVGRGHGIGHVGHGAARDLPDGFAGRRILDRQRVAAATGAPRAADEDFVR